MNHTIQAGIIGGAGYTGGEMLRLLLRHPQVQLGFIHSRSHAGQPVHAVHKDLLGDTDLHFSADVRQDIDVLFLCLGHGESRVFLEQHPLDSSIKVIDLSQDFRLGESLNGQPFVYGLPEFQREAIREATRVANPGCFATAIQLGLLPLARQGLLTEVHTTGITGSTGAGQKLQTTTQHSWRNDNVNAYKTLNHQHLKEIRRTLSSMQPGFAAPLNFIPWRGDFSRGIFISSYLNCPLSLEEARMLYLEYYAGHPFTHVSDSMVDLKQVVNTNKVLLYLEKVEGKLVIHSVEDNLIKGASGQALQNMNLICGLDETAGLSLKSIVF